MHDRDRDIYAVNYIEPYITYLILQLSLEKLLDVNFICLRSRHLVDALIILFF